MAPGSDHVVTLRTGTEDTIWIDVRDQSNGELLETVSAQTLKDFVVIMESLQNQGRYQLCDGNGGCHFLNSVADIDRILANRDVAWSLMVDLQLDEESQYESCLAAALFDAAPPSPELES